MAKPFCFDRGMETHGNNRSRPSVSSLALIAALLTIGGFLLFGSAAISPLLFAEQEASDAAEEAADNQADDDKPRGRVKNPFPNRIKSADLTGGVEWMNASGEITLRDLRGKVVLLDFWTYCCINCLHVLPDLKYLEQKYDKELVVIGVHSGKFDAEKDSENIRQAIVRYEIEHPVVNDANMAIWRKFGARSWPTFVLIDPEGYYCGFISGEGHREFLDGVIGKVIAYHKSKGTLDTTPIRFDLERDKLPPTPLKYPGKILADPENDRLFISDTNHNRIVITTLDGELLEIIGSGAMGSKNGSYEEASFDHPHGTALVDDILYVADTENHMIRKVDLTNKRVGTLAGTGKQGRFGDKGGRLRQTNLNSPWALIYVKGTLYIAMAGPHQLWSHKLDSQRIGVFAGSGREDILDGTLAQSALAQPSGITTDGDDLFIVDSEGSAIRRITRGRNGKVTTVVGPSNLPNGRALFEFGDIDGRGGTVRLQHPLGIVYHDGRLFVADTYNHKIKVVDLETTQTTTFLGDGKNGDSLDPPRFYEPSGLSIAGDRLYITDTNNHRICIADLNTGEVSELVIPGLEPPQRPEPEDADLAFTTENVIQVEPQIVGSGETLQFEISLSLPEGYKLNALTPVTYRLTTEGEQTLIAADHLDTRQQADGEETSVTLSVPLASQTGKALLDLTLSYSFCRDGVGGLCKLDTARWQIPVEVTANADAKPIPLVAADAE